MCKPSQCNTCKNCPSKAYLNEESFTTSPHVNDQREREEITVVVLEEVGNIIGKKLEDNPNLIN